jgi:hypothetical protein
MPLLLLLLLLLHLLLQVKPANRAPPVPWPSVHAPW